MLLAWAYSYIDFDMSRKVKCKALRIYNLKKRTDWEELIMVDTCLHIELRSLNYGDLDSNINKLISIIASNPEFRFCGRYEIWRDC